MNEIAKQARQGSMAAIIQILNEQLADQGVRTRAVLENGILQILCEAATEGELEQGEVVPRVRDILEEIDPQRLRRVSICSRIAQEQQLVWLQEVHRNPEQQLLWSETIVLRKPNIFQRLAGKGKKPLPETKGIEFPSFSDQKPGKRGFGHWRSLLSVMVLCGVSFGAGLVYNQGRFSFRDAMRFSFRDAMRSPITISNPLRFVQQSLSPSSPSTPNSPVVESPNPETSPQPTTVLVPPVNGSPVVSPSEDPFAEAVRLAEQVSTRGQTASTAAEWLVLAEQWERASKLMESVPADDPRYNMAQSRITTYQQNSQVAQRQAKARQ
ncbi:hypothetical protein K4A83_11445 [Spirulina subsalsa FACHB-351]|uniref:Uncharacterized protein n=1 Tax=Spirulina subsalsa FACHB-351 TaxID=234711 RepID=A0ABT3L602_9CYAN|nr:hypothetical protein [Spirulina subsalsa]MCW6036872.1 hypothetical protein [Spirulina subsalsa FACHB-351]